jgi:hypothetical protein
MILVASGSGTFREWHVGLEQSAHRGRADLI